MNAGIQKNHVTCIGGGVDTDKKKYDYQIKMSFSLIIKIQTTWLWKYFNCWWLDVSYVALKDEYNP